jgi:hypothetical protein
MKRMTMAAVLAFACVGSAACSMNRAEQIRYEVPVALDSLDSVMRYEVSALDRGAKEVVLAPARLADREIERQAGHELRLSYAEFRVLSGSEKASRDVIQSLKPGGEVLIYGKRMGVPNAADDIARIALPGANAKDKAKSRS